jgi:hypothetical protein
LKTTHGCKIPQRLLFVSSNPIHTALPQPSSSPVILNNTHKTYSHLLHKNIEILAAERSKNSQKPSRQEHPKPSSSSSSASFPAAQASNAEQGLRKLFRVWRNLGF